ncbi:hypothetical protein, partial [Escherichia coli]
MATNGATNGAKAEEQPVWQPAPHERSPIPGSPPTPWHPPFRRAAYISVAVLVILSGSLGNAIVTAN